MLRCALPRARDRVACQRQPAAGLHTLWNDKVKLLPLWRCVAEQRTRPCPHWHHHRCCRRCGSGGCCNCRPGGRRAATHLCFAAPLLGGGVQGQRQQRPGRYAWRYCQVKFLAGWCPARKTGTWHRSLGHGHAETDRRLHHNVCHRSAHSVRWCSGRRFPRLSTKLTDFCIPGFCGRILR